MWCVWDKEIVKNIKIQARKYIYDASEILFGIIDYPNTVLFMSILVSVEYPNDTSGKDPTVRNMYFILREGRGAIFYMVLKSVLQHHQRG